MPSIWRCGRRCRQLLSQAAADPDLRLLVLRAAEPGAFCAGADIGELLANKADAGWRAANQSAINAAQFALTRFALPTIAFIEGDCVGGGCGLALACDMRIATPRCALRDHPGQAGAGLSAARCEAADRSGRPGQARRMLYTGSLIDADEALRIGLVEALGEDIAEFAEPILAASPHCTREIKRFVRRVLDGQAEDDAETLAIFAEAFTGPDFIEGTSAFAEKRKPEFR